MNPEQLAFWYWLNDVKGIGPVISRKLLDGFGNPENVFNSSKPEIMEKVQIRENIADNLVNSKSTINLYIKLAETQVRLAESIHGSILTGADSPYSEIYHSAPYLSALPSIIHTVGDTTSLQMRKFAIVGTRGPTIEGKQRADKLSNALVLNNFCIVSGLALGIDAEGQRTAIQAGGKTIAVLGSGADVSYPQENASLYSDIKINGLVVSEFPFGVRPSAENLRQRNRTIVALSEGVAIAECPIKSGTMIAARFTLQQNKPLFSFITNGVINNSGNEWLIKNNLSIALKDADVSYILNYLSNFKPSKSPSVDRIFEEIWPKHLLVRQKEQPKKLKKKFSQKSDSAIQGELKIPASASVTKQKSNVSVSKSIPSLINCDLREMDIVTHSIFGKGQIINIEKVKDDYQLTIKFSDKHPRILSYHYANLTKE